MTNSEMPVTFNSEAPLLNGLAPTEILVPSMASSDDNKLVESSRDFMPIGSQRNVQFLAYTDWRYGLKSKSFSIRQFCIIGILIVIVMGLLSRFFLESSLQVPMDPSFDPMQVEFFPKYHNLHDAASDRSLKIFEEDAVKVSSSPSEMLSQESAQEVKSSVENLGQEYASPALEENAIGDERDVKTSLMMPPVGQDDIHQQLDGTETNVADQITTDSTTIEVSAQQKENQIKLFPEDLPQDETLKTSGEDNEIVNLNDAQNTSLVETLQSLDSAMKPNLNSSTGECDLTVGKWVHDLAGPLYRSDQCSILSQPQNCQSNGRPDQGYEFYKWEPDHCSLPRFDPNAFLEMMRGKTLAFIGDSLARNQMESLMCILLQVAKARPKGGKNMHKWYFPSHSFTVVRMWSSWLVRIGGDFPPSAAPQGVTKLNLTELDDYAEHLPTFDVTILSSGHWWLRKTAYFMNGEMLGGTGFRWLPTFGEMKLNHSSAYDIALNNTLQKVGSYPGYRGLTILRTYTPDHYHGGDWSNGGSCTGETTPYQEAPRNPFNDKMHAKQINIFEFNTQNSRGRIMPNGSKLRLLDIYTVLNYRGDGHPGPYRSTDPLKQTTWDSKGHPPPQDCLHWCMPGPLDTVNELLFHLLREEMQ